MNLRIALITPEYPGCGPSHGVGCYVRTLAMALRAAGALVRVLVCSDDGAWRVDAGSPPVPIASGRMPFAVRPAMRCALLRRELVQWQPHVVESPNWGGLGAVARGPWLLVVRWSTPTRLIREQRLSRQLLKPIHHAWESATVCRADAVVADSAAMADIGRRVYGRACDAIIPHAWGGTCEPVVGPGEQVLFVGRLEHRKGVDTLLSAWLRVRRHRPQAVLHLVGSDADGFAARLLPCDGVIAHGWLPEDRLSVLRRACPIQVVPSRFESFGMVVLEAWGAGQAVIASDAPALAEVVGDAGIIVPRNNARALAGAIGHLIDDSERTQDLARRGQIRLRVAYDQGASARANLAFYTRALSQRKVHSLASAPVTAS